MQTITLALSNDAKLKHKPEGRLIIKELVGYLVGNFTLVPIGMGEPITDLRKLRFSGTYEISQAKDFTVLKKSGKNVLVFRTKDIAGIEFGDMPERSSTKKPRPMLKLVSK